MRKLLIADELETDIQSVVNRAYIEVTGLPFECHISETVDEAIAEIRRSNYPLVLSSEFLPDAEPGMPVADLIFGDVLRLLEYCTENQPGTKVCIVSWFTMIPDAEELYRSYPCVIDVFGSPHSDRQIKKLYKRLRKLLDDFAGVKVSL